MASNASPFALRRLRTNDQISPLALAQTQIVSAIGPKAHVRERAERVRSAQVLQTSTYSAIGVRRRTLCRGNAQCSRSSDGSARAETFYVLEGECVWHVGEKTIRATPGTYLFIPPGAPRNITNANEAPGRVLMTVSPPRP